VTAEAAVHPLIGHYLRHSRQSSFFQSAPGLVADMDEATIRQMRATYCGMIAEVDDCLGRVFDFLEQTGQWGDTLIIFTSDHGEQLGDHRLLGKIGFHDESFRIPLVIVDPDAPEQAGRIETAFTESIDLMPTMLDWMGAEVPRACDGRSLLPLVHDAKPADWRTELHYEYDFRDTFHSRAESDLGLTMDTATLSVIQDNDYKYVHFTAMPPLLFDLKSDPHQFTNLAEHPDYTGIAKTYAQKTLSWRMFHADRTLTHYRATPHGLEIRTPQKDPA
jgi:arylsulfatase A-like enzyme